MNAGAVRARAQRCEYMNFRKTLVACKKEAGVTAEFTVAEEWMIAVQYQL